MITSYNEIIKSLEKKKPFPVYFLYGDEPYYIDKIVRIAEQNLIPEEEKSFNLNIYYGKDLEVAQAISSARQYPFVGQRLVVIIKEAQELKNWNNANSQDVLIKYLSNPSPTTTLFLAYKYKSIDSRTKLGKALASQSVYFNSQKIYDNKIPEWINTYVTSKNKKISQQASLLLSENIGSDLHRLENEIEKILLNVNKDDIVEEDIYKFSGINKDFNVFQLQSAIAKRNIAKAIQIGEYFSDNPSKNPMVLILINLFNYFSKLLLVHQSNSMDNKTIGELLGLHPFIAQEYVLAAQNYPLEKVCENIKIIYDYDLRSKGVYYNMNKKREEGFLKELIFKLMV